MLTSSIDFGTLILW